MNTESKQPLPVRQELHEDLVEPRGIEPLTS